MDSSIGSRISEATSEKLQALRLAITETDAKTSTDGYDLIYDQVSDFSLQTTSHARAIPFSESAFVSGDFGDSIYRGESQSVLGIPDEADSAVILDDPLNGPWLNAYLALANSNRIFELVGENPALEFIGRLALQHTTVHVPVGNDGLDLTLQGIVTPQLAVLKGGECRYVVVGSNREPRGLAPFVAQAAVIEHTGDFVSPLAFFSSGETTRLEWLEFQDQTDLGSCVSMSELSWRSRQAASHSSSLQANSVERLVELARVLRHHPQPKSELSFRLQIEPRQVDYYLDAARTLGLVVVVVSNHASISMVQATDYGREVAATDRRQSRIAMLRRLTTYAPFTRGFSLASQGELSQSDANRIVSETDPQLAMSTIERRANALRAWVKWANRECANYEVDLGQIIGKGWGQYDD